LGFCKKSPAVGTGTKAMRGKTENIKGRVKEAAGVWTENKKLARSGRTDQAAGKVKQKISRITESVTKKLHKFVDKVIGRGGI
jgi:uncharacterized protein YjbJ (UPF0337 family)